MGIRDWIFGRPRGAGILRELTVDLTLRAGSVEPTEFLDQAALMVREAGLEHLVLEATLSEVEALVRAGTKLELDRVAALIAAQQDVPLTLKPYDGGKAIRRQMLDVMKGGA